ncbi:hypothetical protein ANN_23672 [Periplaneta americana]|uniref:Uncharacterized protein n=1 Tax=Periplaneta americana TaxID=6978 RepID=A0ABQ8SN72_PERAM|nr:hypothetical protein ANN_23672 [Periplaneta americana]
MSPGSSTESYPAFALIELRENPGKNLNQVTCPDRESNPGHLVSRLDVLTHRKLPSICSYWVKGNPRKKPQPGNLLRPGIEPGPPGFPARRANRYSTGVDNNGIRQAVTVNGERYYSMLQNFVIPRPRNHDMDNIIFMQDGAQPHIFIPAKQLITQTFGDRVISRIFPTMWPPRSPYFNPVDFWLWGYLKERVFLTHPTTLLQLKDAISQEIANIPRHYLQNAAHGVADNAVR